MRTSKVPTAGDVLTILDAVYDVQQPRESWLRGVLNVLASTWSRGAGVGGVLYDVSSDHRVDTPLIDGLGTPPGWEDAGLAVHRDARFIPHIIARYRSVLCATLPDLIDNPQIAGALADEHYERHGVRGQIMVNGADCSGKGCTLYFFSDKAIALSAPQRDLFSRLATHLATAYRLQRRLDPGAPAVSVGPDAVLTPNGRLEHAEPAAQTRSARQALELAVRQRELARDSSHKDADRVVRSRRGLVEAQWTLLDEYKSGGERYILARENAPRPVGPARLTTREQQVVALAKLGRTNKFIAYELGLAHSTVRVLMARACAKLGAPTRSALVSIPMPPDSST
jgi:DNA-binding CsgD family transcriptional regulator